MRWNDLRLLPGATAVWVLAVLGIAAGAQAAIATCAILAATVLTAAVVIARPVLTQVLLAHLGVVALAGVLLFPVLLRHDHAVDQLSTASEDALIVEVAITLRADPAVPTTGPAWSRSGMQAMARTLPTQATIGDQDVPLPASVPVLMRTGDAEAEQQLAQARGGDAVQVRGKVRASGGLLVLTVTEVRPIPERGATAVAQNARQQLRDLARHNTRHLPGDEAALVRGMTSGDTHGLGDRSEEIMQRAGISHLVAVSGANIALVLAAVIAPLLLAGVRRRPRLLIAGLAVAAYVGLVGEEPSVQRAATMVTPLLIARYVGVRASPVAALALTVALWSVLDPVTAASIGFALSALATAAILIGAPPLARAITEATGERIGKVPALVLAVPLVAQLACTPILVTLAPEVSAWAVPVNMIVGPIVGPTTVIGLIALLMGPVWAPAAQLLNTIAAGGAHLVLLIARTADALPGSRIPVLEGTAGVLGAVAVIVVLAIAVAGRRSPLVRWAMAGLLVAVTAPGLAPHLPGREGQEWTVAACAVGQGDAVLLRSGSTTVLIDTGPAPEPLRECLNRLDVDHIDLLILTHPHADHTGGRTALTGSRAPAQQWVCPLPHAGQDVAEGGPPEPVTTGETWQQDGLALEVLWPPSAEAAQSAALREDGSGEGDAANDCSVTIAATWPDGTRLVSLGDLEPVAQRELAALQPGPAHIVKVAHHGSRRQHDALYEQLDPGLALVTVGKENTFGHPTDHTLDLLGAVGAQVVRTDLHGTVILPAHDPAESADPLAPGSPVDAEDRHRSGEPRSVGPPR
ncbi:competence protein ComEC [Brachybacterium muris]|uniref:ComEC/Rec2 family competence protein n=1 Tax=Brachybacterium muris TaxID=219301 RepID=UPI00195A1202|nr:ComEC/Rec2 family competence protein [Brachybacterium muris]MBM7500838.1 competence protein ComEC [Brachybacterium muris]MCT1429319.1 ComEC/Rec2 family competence protein [Brachybacterium muris]MCT2177381.1 ComEC/Rec2 family competence protein [Brachybacterium muris]